MPNAAMGVTHDVFMECRRPNCNPYRSIVTFVAQIEVTGEGTFYVDGTDRCPQCGENGERANE